MPRRWRSSRCSDSCTSPGCRVAAGATGGAAWERFATRELAGQRAPWPVALGGRQPCPAEARLPRARRLGHGSIGPQRAPRGSDPPHLPRRTLPTSSRTWTPWCSLVPTPPATHHLIGARGDRGVAALGRPGQHRPRGRSSMSLRSWRRSPPGRLAGAALDVFEQEPLPRQTARCGACPNVLVSPHSASTVARENGQTRRPLHRQPRPISRRSSVAQRFRP